LIKLIIELVYVRVTGSVLSNPYDTGKDIAKRIFQTNAMKKLSLSTRLGIPLLYAVDAVHGHNTFIDATIFPHNVGLGATRYICK